MSYILSAELAGAEDSVRAACGTGIGGMEKIYVGGQDRLVREYDSHGNPSFIMIEATGWVTAIVARTESDGSPTVITGSRDTKIRIYRAGSLIATVTGHEGGITSLAWGLGNTFLSGSWDGTCRMWSLDDLSCKLILPGHENSVSVICLPNGDIVTGSSGVQSGSDSIIDFQIRLFREGKQVKSMRNHTAGVRALCVLPSIGFVSVGNDSCVNVWSGEGSLLLSMVAPQEGGAGFLLCVAALSNGDVVTGGDDCCLRVWRNGENVQSILHPNTVWGVAALGNGDVVTCCGDKMGRVFTCDPARIAPEEVMERFQLAVSQASSSAKGSEVEVNKLPLFSTRGTAADGKVQMFNKNGRAFCYRFDASLGDWIELGEVVSQANSKTMLNGVEYDHVIDVEMETSNGLSMLKLGYHDLESPYEAAQRFINENGLEQTYLDQIATYIGKQKASRGPTLGMGGGASAPPPPPFTHIPTKCNSKFDQLPNLDGLTKKLTEFNSSLAVPLNVTVLESIIHILQNASHYHSASFISSHYDFVEKAIAVLPYDQVFPVLDLLRMMLIIPDCADHYQGSSGSGLVNLLLHKVQGQAPISKGPTHILTLRVLANIARGSSLSSLRGSTGNDVMKYLSALDLATSPPSLHQALAAFLLNLTYGLDKVTINHVELTALILKVMSITPDASAVAGLSVALGTLVLNGAAEVKQWCVREGVIAFIEGKSMEESLKKDLVQALTR